MRLAQHDDMVRALTSDCVALLYLAGELFACRRCYGLAYASQRKALYFCDIDKAQKIRTRLGGRAVMLERFPDKPKGMHWKRMSGSAVLTMPPSAVRWLACCDPSRGGTDEQAAGIRSNTMGDTAAPP